MTAALLALAELSGAWLRASMPAYALVNALHILGLGLLVGAVAALDLRLLGAVRTLPAAPLAALLERVAGAGLALALVTGLLLFSVRPAAYLGNPAFLLKLGFVGAGLLNVLVLRFGPGWRALASGARPSAAVRIGVAFSLALWIAALLAGRWIAFVE